MILTAAQAEAIYSAMCALNNVGGALRATMPQANSEKWLKVRECEDFGTIKVIVGFTTAEVYADQNAFAQAYGLQTGA